MLYLFYQWRVSFNEIFLFSDGYRAHPALSPGVKRPWREAYHSRLVPRLTLLILLNSVKSCLLFVVLMYLSSHVTSQLYGTKVLS